MIVSLEDALLAPSPTREELLRQREALITAMRAALVLLNAGPVSIADSPQIRTERAIGLLRGGIARCAQ